MAICWPVIALKYTDKAFPEKFAAGVATEIVLVTTRQEPLVCRLVKECLSADIQLTYQGILGSV
jgi:hypothetical protein